MLMSSASVASRALLPTRAVAVFGLITAVTFSAASSAPTPLYHFYQQQFALSPLLVTVIFASYAFSLLAALLTVGSLSDYVGRRPVVFAALALNAVALLLFITANSAGQLILARVVQGFATGTAITTLGAAILDSDKVYGAVLNSITAFLGLAVGSLGAGALAAFAPAPGQLVYVILLVASALEALLLLALPETTAGRPGALASLQPRVHVPVQARRALLQVTPLNIAIWALGGFYLSLMPSLVRVATGIASPFAGGAVVAALMAAATLGVLLVQKWAAAPILLAGMIGLIGGVVVTLLGIGTQSAGVLVAGTVLAGLGFGAAFSGILRTVLPLASAGERAGLLAAFYVEAYLAFALPAIAAGLAAPALGLATTAYVYGAAQIVLAIISFAATRLGAARAASAEHRH